MLLLCYFRTEAEALHLASSEDGLHWQPLNGNRPVLTGTVGARTLRDPFVFQAQDGRFHLLATNGWQSDSIVHAVSEDLLAWSEQRLLPIMQGVPGVRNCWAPECFFDRQAKRYQLLWSSSITPPTPGDDWNHRIWGATTADFADFSPAELFFDPGYSVIDATVAWHEGIYRLAFKDERGENRRGTTGKAIWIGESEAAAGPWNLDAEFVTPALTEGPALFRHEGEWRLIFDYFFEQRYGAMRSADGRQWQAIEAGVSFPPGARHASVLTLNGDLAQKLSRHYTIV